MEAELDRRRSDTFVIQVSANVTGEQDLNTAVHAMVRQRWRERTGGRRTRAAHDAEK
jgi:hypothetical protein